MTGQNYLKEQLSLRKMTRCSL